MTNVADKRNATGDEGLFRVEKGVLRAGGDMYWECLEEFDEACRELLKSRRNRIEIDLSEVNFISSSFLGCLGSLMLKASRLKKGITLKVTLDTSWLFDIMGVHKGMRVEVV